jgi:hypothetical protein
MTTALAATALAQDPSRHYSSIETNHFRITFTKPLEPFARRVATHAETAYAQLSAELHPPRGRIDVLISDDVDYSNGSAIPYPTNRIVIYATPPVNDFGLRYTTDWSRMVVTHELTHIFHLDRSRGLWRLGQYVFGRSPFLFPNTYQPSWMIEGLAVYEESRLAGEGRIAGPEHNLIVRSAAAERHFPSIGQASLAFPAFPGGSAAYVYGSLFMDYLARTRGDSSIRKYVEASSINPIPYFIDVPARSAFGESFGKAWAEWDSLLTQTNPGLTPPSRGWRDLSTLQYSADYPRWQGARTITFTGTTGKEAYQAWALSLDGRRTSLGRRNGASPTVMLPDSSTAYVQFEYTSPYQYRSDLYVERGGDARRVTDGERLFTPDGRRADGAIVAAQVAGGGSRLVRVALNGEITPITSASLDTMWSEPRWSPRGDALVAARWIRGGVSQIVVIDTLGVTTQVLASGPFLAASPSWLPGGAGVLFTVGDSVSNTLYLSMPGATPNVQATARFSDGNVFEPDARQLDTTAYAALSLHADGYRVGFSQLNRSLLNSQGPPPQLVRNTASIELPAIAPDTSPAHPYSALGQLMPRYWVPLFDSGIYSNSYRLGGYTEGWDILRRHYVYGDVRFPSDGSGVAAALQYEYRGLGLPILDFNASQDWAAYGSIMSNTTPAQIVGTIRRRSRDAELLATWSRPRVRSALSVSLGAGIETRGFATDPSQFLAGLDTVAALQPASYPRLTFATGYARNVTPPSAISPEDGFSVTATVRERFRSGNGNGAASTSAIGAASLYKSLDLPGYAHHVIAARGSVGWTDIRSPGYFLVGGVSGGTFQVVPGYTLGEGRKSFPVRGFPIGAIYGATAMSGSIEYRAPLTLRHLGLGTLPAFLQRTAVTAFGDYGSASCPNTDATRDICNQPALATRRSIASVGGELSLNAGVLSWDTPYRFRLGFAHPVHNASAIAVAKQTIYLASGISF